MNLFKNGIGRPTNNIKRARFLVAAIAILLTVSIGYALFSQEVKVTGTATASGSFVITPTCRIAKDNETGGSTTNNKVAFVSGTPTCTVNATTKEVTVTANLTQPGAYAYFLLTMTNSGTIDATLSSIAGSADSGFSYTKEGNNYIIKTSDGLVKMTLYDTSLPPITSLAHSDNHNYIIKAEWLSTDTSNTKNVSVKGSWTFNWSQAN